MDYRYSKSVIEIMLRFFNRWNFERYESAIR